MLGLVDTAAVKREPWYLFHLVHRRDAKLSLSAGVSGFRPASAQTPE